MTKTCPNCSSDVPYHVFRCKHCFYDFSEKNQKARFPLSIFVTLFIIGLLTVAITDYIVNSRESTSYVFDEESKSMLIAQKTSKGLTANRVAFKDLKEIEHVTGGDYANYELWIGTQDGKRFLVAQSQSPLSQQGESTAKMIEQKLVKTNKSPIGK